jgi:hypothetical protein
MRLPAIICRKIFWESGSLQMKIVENSRLNKSGAAYDIIEMKYWTKLQSLTSLLGD